MDYILGLTATARQNTSKVLQCNPGWEPSPTQALTQRPW